MRHPKRSLTREIRSRRPKHPGRAPDEVEALTWPEAGIKVRELMTRSPLTVRWDATIGTAWKLKGSEDPPSGRTSWCATGDGTC